MRHFKIILRIFVSLKALPVAGKRHVRQGFRGNLYNHKNPFAMKRLIEIMFMLTVCLGYGWAQGGISDSLRRSLIRLDSVIAHRGELHVQYDQMLDSLRKVMERTADVEQKYQLCGALFYWNLHYQADSSYYYVGRKEALLKEMDRPDRVDEIRINRAEVQLVRGNWNKAREELRACRPQEMTDGMRQYYYGTFCNYYTWMASLSVDEGAYSHFRHRANTYRDSILQLLPEGVSHDIVFSNLLLERESPDKVIGILTQKLQAASDPKERTYLNYSLAEAYAAKRDTLHQMYYLSETAYLDIRNSVREYLALPMLAWLVYRQGNLERAYRYADCAIQDSYACNSSLRPGDGARFLPIIQRSMAEKIHADYSHSRRMLLLTAVLVLLLTTTVSALAWWMRKLAKMRQLLETTNHKLADSNSELKQTGNVKDTYIREYMDRCVGYIENMESYRRSLEKLAMARNNAELYKAIRSVEFLRQERKSLYADFDRTFLELFPHFIRDVNALLAEDCQLEPKQGEQLSTELRVLALIRLGMTDTSRIARFLGCSLTTVYNYRSRMRNNARQDKKDKFEEYLMECG